MRIGVISDIHSNVLAFRACIEKLESLSCDEYIFLGDYVSDTPYTRETIDTLYEFMRTHSCRLLRGNREEYMLAQRKVLRDGPPEARWSWNSASGNLLYAYSQLTEADLDFFESLSITFRYEHEGYPSITCCHGSPNNARELLQLNGENTRSWLDRIDTDYMLCAHTHFPGEAAYKGKRYYNSGCVGISIADTGYAQCMYLDGVEEETGAYWKPTFLKVPYDYKQVVRDLADRGLLEKAHWFINSNIQIILTGIDHAADMVALANELIREDGAPDVWPNIREEYFERAAKALGIPDYRDPQTLHQSLSEGLTRPQ